MKFGTGSNAERTQEYGGSKYKMTYIRPEAAQLALCQLTRPCPMLQSVKGRLRDS